MTKKKAPKVPVIPKKRTMEYWDYNEVIEYVEEKYGFKSRDYAGKFYGNESPDARGHAPAPEADYLDFWHWLLDRVDVHNGCLVYLSVSDWLADEDTPAWVKEILQKIYDEFQEDEMQVWIWW